MKNIVMKTKLFALGIACLFYANASVAQQGCPQTQGNLIISTGIDPATGTILPPGAGDPMWTLIQSPPPPGGWPVTLGAPAFVIPTSGSWDAAPAPSTYINAFNTNASVTNNWTLGTLEYIYERPFCVCNKNGSNDSISVTFDLKLHSDNWAEVFFVDGGGGATSLLAQPYVYSSANFLNPTNDALVTIMMPPGSYTLEIHQRNKGVYMGVSLWGALSSSGLLSDSDCSPDAFIVGNKYEDIDGNGIISGPDVVVPGWVIELYNGGVLVATTITDGGGFYSFSGLPPGVYTVTEVPLVGWTMVNPASGSQTVSVNVNSVTTVDFLNERDQVNPDPCDIIIDIEKTIEKCGLTLNTFISNIPAGYMIMSSTWTFGDGYSSNLLNPTHYYGTVGVYDVCIEVIVFNGDKCCTVKQCFEVRIEEPCEDGCNIQAEIGVEELHDCEFQFFGNIMFTGTPITNWVWNFGDGTTGTGSNVTHTYSTSGTYVVTLTVFGFSPNNEECCFITITKEVIVNCEPQHESKIINAGSTVNADAINNVILYPNPSNGTVKISFDLVNDDQVSIIIIDASGTKVYSGVPFYKSSGTHEIELSTDLPSGVYTSIISTRSNKVYKKLIIL